jgi:hypothetical protein
VARKWSAAANHWLQKAGRLRHAVVDLAVCAVQGRIARRFIGVCCSQDCGQRPPCSHNVSGEAPAVFSPDALSLNPPCD